MCGFEADPGLITQTKPGELFICRTVGNIVPAWGETTGGVSATIEYAVLVLGVKDVIVCGHSDCGAMKGVLYPQSVAKLKAVSSWLSYGDRARMIVQESYSHLEGEMLLRVLTEQNVITQLDNLRTHPSVAARLEQGLLNLHGWMYDIRSGNVSASPFNHRRFVPLRTVRPVSSSLERPVPVE